MSNVYTAHGGFVGLWKHWCDAIIEHTGQDTLVQTHGCITPRAKPKVKVEFEW